MKPTTATFSETSSDNSSDTPLNKSASSIFSNKLFLTVLLIKIILAFFFGSDYIIKGTIPFVNYFIESGFQNPYYFFANYVEGFVGFPYPSVMLFVLTPLRFISGFLFSSVWNVAAWNVITPLNLFVIKVPLLIADLTIFYVLVKLLKSKEKLVLLLYWCSPILIYINYFHGQLDAIAIAFLFLSLYFIYQNKFIHSSVLLGLGVATKTHLALVIPFYFIYLWKQRLAIKRLLGYGLLTIVACIIPMLPYLNSKSFFETVFLAREQFGLFDLAFNLGFLNVELFIIPMILVITFLVAITYKNINKELLFMLIAFVFSILLIFVSPRPGWYYWIIPFIVFFLIREGKRSHFIVYGLFHVFYFAYFLFYQNSDIFHSFQLVSSKIAAIPAPYYLVQNLSVVQNLGISVDLISNVLITLLTATLIILVYWIYKLGIQINLKYNLVENPLTVGIGGDSSSGKTTLTNLIVSLTGKDNISIISGDDIHRWERGDPHWQKVTHLNPEANRLFLNLKHAKNLVTGKYIKRSHYDHSTGKFTMPHKIFPKRFVIFEGLHQFITPGMRNVYDLRIFLDIDEKLRKYWKINRDMAKRSYSRKKILKQLRKREPDSRAFIKPQAKYADLVVKYLPMKDKKRIKKGVKLDFSVEVESKIHIDLESLSRELMEINSITFKYKYDKDLVKQICQFKGDIREEEVRRIAFALVPELMNLLNNFHPVWESGKKGLLQLIMLMHIDEVLTMKRRGK